MTDKDDVDPLSLFILPSNGPKGLEPVKTVGDGNCLYRSVAHLAFGDDERHKEVRVTAEAVKNKHLYIDGEYLYRGSLRRNPKVDIVDLFCMQSLVHSDHNSEEKNYENEVHRSRKLRAWGMSFHFFQIANIFNRTVRLVFLEMEDLIHDDMKRFMVPQDGLHSKTYNIMWTTCDNQKFNHFVPLMHGME